MVKNDSYRLVKPWYQFIQAITRLAFKLAFGITVKGLDRVPKTGAVIFAPVHMSNLDPPLIGCFTRRYVRFMAKEELFKGFMGWLIHSVGAFPVARGAGDSTALRIARATLEEGGALVMFPEGSRGNGKELGEIQSGFSMLAEKSGALVVPIGLSGTELALGVGAKKPRRAHITLVFGEPVSFSQLGLTGRGDRDRFAQELAKRLVETTREAGLKLEIKPLD